ncbi:HTH domain-containing protein [uncultured Roseovarius sp.]|uniref:HTH domain-containing protein n=1 Tax=uncultured Roseovarius sp. TaxID=293344 RepID=UPI000C623506|nr:hypothetical protein [Roseovarius sp.]MBD11664.1 hypothetical protein [Roseovarius sp.]|tara:strand:- start:133 stop:915 length:783 start_codon:yes stop_codon:yes gene_type:complete
MSELGWDEAIKVVLGDSDEPLHYTTIAEEIAKRELRQKLGATPANTVNAYINNSLNSEGVSSPYVRTSRGFYSLKASRDPNSRPTEEESKQSESSGLIQCIGMYWWASEIVWKSNPRLFGQQQAGSDRVDFSDQIGVYILHDRSRVIYVGRSIDRPMGRRLFEHTKDRLNGRWDRFSWFGLRSVSEEGQLRDVDTSSIDRDTLIATLEAVLIEALEPPQNRRRGDQFSAIEYLQVADPDKDKQKIDAITALISGTLFSTS